MSTTRFGLVAAGTIALILLALGAMSAAASPLGAGDPGKGKYIVAIDGGCGCHGPNLAGFNPSAPPGQSGEIFAGPFGSVTAKNITPDKDTGIGNWTDERIINAIRNGVDDQGKQLFPIMPYASFHFMSDGDVADLVAFIRTVPAVANQVPENELNIPVPPAPPLPPSPPVAPTAGVARGQYLASAIAICGDCHTPTAPDGSPDMSRLLAGGSVQSGPDTVEYAPNLTPDRVTGIGGWSDYQLRAVLKYGLEPEGGEVMGLMRDQVAGGPLAGGGYSLLTSDDAQAIVAYLRTLPRVSHVAATDAGFQLGFKALSDMIPEVVGLPLEPEHPDASGNMVQATTGGLMVYRPSDNTTAFTDGATTWTLTASGVQSGPNR